MGITVYDLVDLFIESSFQTVEVWDVSKEEVIFVGTLGEMPLEIQDLTVQSIDNLTKISSVLTVNVDTEF